MDNLKIGDSTNRKIIEKFFDISLTGWQASSVVSSISNFKTFKKTNTKIYQPF
jgi:hypothetical protein